MTGWAARELGRRGGPARAGYTAAGWMLGSLGRNTRALALRAVERTLGDGNSRRLRAAGRRVLGMAHARSPWAFRMARSVPERFRIGMAVLAHERPDYLEMCLDSLFRTNLCGYDITF